MSTAIATQAGHKPGLAIETIGHTPALVRTGKSLAQLEAAIAHYPEPIRIEVRWLQGYFLETCLNNGELLRSTCAKLGHDKSREYFRNLICGDYFKTKASTWQTSGRAWSEFTEMMSSLRRHAKLAARLGRLPFVQTPTYHCIANFITAKRAPSAVCRIGGIIAPTGGQTSESFQFYQSLNNHGQVIHVEAPANGRLTSLQGKILEKYNSGITAIERRREHEIREQVNENRSIIIDNAQVLYLRGRGNDQPAFNWIREIYDDKRPTIILKFTEEFLGDLTGAAAKGYFEQFIGRMGGLNGLLRLPAHAPDSDLQCIARAFKLAPSAVNDYLHKWSRQPGRIRIVFEKLQLAQQLAGIAGHERITLDDLQGADEYVPPSTGADVVDDEGGAS
jgi:hypothetical protein